MGSPITFSGFNNIDFGVILNAIMEQERVPLASLERQQTSLNQRSSTFGTLATKLSTLETAAANLNTASAFGQRAVTNTAATAVTVAATDTTPLGTYDIVVQELARAQVTGSNSAHSDENTTVVASGGSLTIGGTAVTITGDVTLEGLRDAINATSGIGVTASIVTPTVGSYQLVLTGTSTGSANAFTITNALTGGAAPVTFIDTDMDGESGDSAADNATQATDAQATINNITVSSATNTLASAIPGATVTLIKKDPATTVTVGVSQDVEDTKSRITSFVDAYNDLLGFFNSQAQSAIGGDQASIGRDGLVRALRVSLASTLSAQYAVGGSYSALGEVGIGFEVDGTLSFDASLFDAAVESGTTDVQKLFVGSGGTDGVFKTLASSVEEYTQSGGLIPDAQTRLGDQVTALTSRIAAFEERLAIRRLSLQQEFSAADAAMKQLNNQAGQLGQLGSQYRLF